MEHNQTMNQAFRYHLIRFQPDAETEEFAVIGVVVYSPTTHELAYRLIESDQYQRVHDFFSPIDARLLPATVEMMTAELKRVQKLLPEVPHPARLYEELVREREDIVRFAPAGSMSGKTAQACADELFQRYIKRHAVVVA